MGTRTDFKEEGLCIKIYDIETKKPIETYNSYKLASKALFINWKIIHKRCVSKSRLFVPSLNKEVAIRLERVDKVA